jgi:L-fuconolactonase
LVIDAHHHLWKYNDRDYVWMSGAQAVLRCDFLIPELQQVMRESGVEGTVAVQARQMVEETEFLLDLAARHPFILGVVGWVPLIDPNVDACLERYAGNPRLKAVRHVLHDEADPDYMLRDDFNRGIGLLKKHGVVYDILIFEGHLPQTLTLVDRHPGQVFVIDHVAKPRIRGKVISPWKENMQQLAKRENVYCKVSGMANEADWSHWTANDLRPYFDVVLAAFGPKRLMFGSDWPVVRVAGGYKKWMTAFLSFIGELSGDEQRSICRETALAAYGLGRANLGFRS